jgi:hypothetical protein
MNKIISGSKKIKMNKKIFFTIISFTLLFWGVNLKKAEAQTTVSPYSIYGPGELVSGGFGTNHGMGGAGLSLKSKNYLNNLNPASYVGMDSLKLIMEFGLQGKLYDLHNNSQSVTGFDGNVAYFALGFKYTSWLAGSIGLQPFSMVGYDISRTEYVEGMENQEYTVNYIGTGGISRFYFANSINLYDKVSLGVNFSYMFGPLTQEEHLEETTVVPEIIIIRKDYVRSIYFDFGLQTGFKLNNTNYTLGLTYAPKQYLYSKHYATAYDEDYSAIQTEEGSDDNDYGDNLAIPQMAGIGIGVEKKHYTFALDYNFQQWSDVDYPNQVTDFVDSHKFSLGVNATPWDHRAINPGYKNWTYRMGYSYESSYLKFGATSFDTHEMTLGIGVPLYGGVSNMDISLSGGRFKSSKSSLTKEHYLLLNVGFSLNEFAFFKRKID